MRSSFVFGTVILSVFFFSQTLFGNKEKAEPQLSVKQQFNSEVENLKRNLKSARSSEEKFRILTSGESALDALRKNNPLQVAPDEFYMDLLSYSLKQIPRGRTFNREECPDYRTSILAQFDPNAQSRPIEPIAKTLQILEFLCE